MTRGALFGIHRASALGLSRRVAELVWSLRVNDREWFRQPEEKSQGEQAVLVQNWTEELKRLVPVD